MPVPWRMLTPEDLAKYLEVMKAAGCSRFQQGDLRIEFRAEKAAPRATSPEEILNTLMPGGRKMTDDDWLFAASEGIPTGEPEKPEH